MPLAEDFTDFLDVTEHATLAYLDGRQVVGIFEDPNLQAFGGGINSSSPTFLLQASDVAHATQLSQLRLSSGAVYRVRSFAPDGTGMSVLELELQP